MHQRLIEETLAREGSSSRGSKPVPNDEVAPLGEGCSTDWCLDRFFAATFKANSPNAGTDTFLTPFGVTLTDLVGRDPLRAGLAAVGESEAVVCPTRLSC